MIKPPSTPPSLFLEAALSVPVISNGSIQSVEDAELCLEYTGCDACMSAVGLLRRPFMFGQEWRAAKVEVGKGSAVDAHRARAHAHAHAHAHASEEHAPRKGESEGEGNERDEERGLISAVG